MTSWNYFDLFAHVLYLIYFGLLSARVLTTYKFQVLCERTTKGMS